MLMDISLFWTPASVKDGNKAIGTKYLSFINLLFGTFYLKCAVFIQCDLYLMWAGEFLLIQKMAFILLHPRPGNVQK